MHEQRAEDIKGALRAILERAGKNTTKGLNSHQEERVIDRLVSFVDQCDECQQKLDSLARHIGRLQNQDEEITRNDIKHLKQEVSEAISHLQEGHQLVVDGQYMATYMSLGTSLGLVFGLTVFDNLALGLPFGLAIGVAIGSSMDSKAKKDGRQI